MTEFELIRTFFASQPVSRGDVALGIGDDAAVLESPPGMQAVVATDLLISGVHFLPEADPVSVGHKALAVNLSDLAAMGADPAWFTLGLALPRLDEAWLQRFCEGIYGLARRYNVQLIGGDTVRGPLAVAIQAGGWVPRGQALTRAGAQPGDRLFVTGVLGDAGLALLHQLGRRRLPEMDITTVIDRLDRPMPRIEAGVRLRGIATSAIDISDGLIADLGHVLEASKAGARVHLDRLPVSAVYRSHLGEIGWDLALAAGEDYELLFTVPESSLAVLESARSELGCDASCIGEITRDPELAILDAAGRPYRAPPRPGYDHFA